jgi:signal peptidase I
VRRQTSRWRRFARALTQALTRVRAAARRRRLEPVLVAGESMLPTLAPGTRLAVAAPRHPPRRGQIVLVRYPGRGLELVKRVVGLPGERVTLAGASLRIDGRSLAEPYVRPGPRAGAGPSEAPELELRLGPRQYLVLGDRREASTDGRSFGPVRLEDILAVARFAYWPPRAWTAPLGPLGSFPSDRRARPSSAPPSNVEAAHKRTKPPNA